ncbi:MAG: hypothetical protein IJ480_09000 [Clostridia bacterium]|nr:hypothetical protein [Clostridia bacterium]
MEEKKLQEEYNLPALAEAMLLDGARLPASMMEDLQTLRQMLEDAVAGGTETTDPVPPAYGKTAVPAGEALCEDGERCLRLRNDIAENYPVRLTELSERQDGQYVTVPQVVRQGGNHA